MLSNDFVWEEKVRIYDTDAQGIVHYAGYYRFFTDAFEQFSKSKLGSEFPLLNSRIWFVVVESHAKYYKPARLGDKLSTHVNVEIVGKKAMCFNFKIYKGKYTICDGKIVQVAIDSKTWKAVVLPKNIVTRIKKL